MEAVPTPFLLKQLRKLSLQTEKLLWEKIELTEQKTYRNKRLIGTNLYRIRFSDRRKEKRLVYFVDPPFVRLLFILDRKKGYRDVEEFLKKTRF